MRARAFGADMKKLFTCAVAGALAAGAIAAPAANANTACTAVHNATHNKYVDISGAFEQMMIYMGDEATFVLRTACSTGP